MQSYKNSTRRVLRISLFTLLFTNFALAQELSPQAKRIREHVKVLASDSLEGRGSGTEGNRKAARYIEQFFRNNSIRPMAKGYQQEFSLATGLKMGTDNRLGFQGMRDDIIGRTEGKDFIPLSFSANGRAEGPLVFAGYGITNREKKHDDYAALDVTDKIVLVLRGSPDGDNPHGDFAQQAPLRAKALNAREHGAKGIIFVNNKSDSSGKLIELNLDNSAPVDIIALHASRALLPDFMQGLSLETMEEGYLKTGTPTAAGRNYYAYINVNLVREESPTANVIGFVPGTDAALSNEYIVLGAHFDHLGRGGHGSLHGKQDSSIHYGADDNASGTAALMEIAARVAQKPLRRPVAFMAFSGEERGLLGSAFFTKNPLIPLENIIAMLNMDMVGRMKDSGLNVQGVGTSPVWETMLDSLNKGFSLKLTKGADGFGPSDHSSFYAKNIPVLFFFTGLHSDYHRPGDTWDKLNYEGETTVLNFVESILRSTDARRERPSFSRAAVTQQRQNMGFRVSIGIVPDYGDDPRGLRITGVREGSPGEKAGLKADDIITKLGDTAVKNIYDYTYALGKFSPGDRTTVELLRDGAPLKLDITMEGRK